MPGSSDLLRQAEEAKAKAARARRLATNFTLSTDDAVTLLEYAKEQEELAQTLEAQSRPSHLSLPLVKPVVTEVQQQSDAQHGSAPVNPAEEPR